MTVARLQILFFTPDDPELLEGDVLTLMRQDGRALWSQRLRVIDVARSPDLVEYVLTPEPGALT